MNASIILHIYSKTGIKWLNAPGICHFRINGIFWDKEFNMKRMPFLLNLIQGSIGKKYVVKHYRKGIVVTKYPHMTGIIASKKQVVCRASFAEAAAYARDI